MRYHLIRHRGGIFKIYEDGSIEVVEEPKIRYCPGVYYGYGFKELDLDKCVEILRIKIEKYGLFTPNRKFESDVFVPFGASEMIMSGLRRGLLDAAVTVCDGAGTVITSNPKLVQGIGARLTGIIKTYPIKEIIEYIKMNNGYVLDESNATIDCVRGVEEAIKLGFKNIAVTVAGFESNKIGLVRSIESKSNANIVIFVVCTTGVSRDDAYRMLNADLVWASASKYVREIVGVKAILQVGLSIPVFILTKRGKEIALNHILDLDIPMVIHRIKPPYLKTYKSPDPLI